jgi:hypothetical protein
VTVFNGFSGERFVARWRPDGPGFSRIVLPGEDAWGAIKSAIL